MKISDNGQLIQEIVGRFSNISLEEESTSAYYKMKFQYKNQEFHLSLYNPNKDTSYFDIGLAQLQKVTTGMNPEDQNMLYWHVTSILDKINKELDRELESH